MDNRVIIKSSKYGLLVHLDPNIPYAELLTEIEQKFSESAKFFDNAKMAVSLEGRMLTKGQEREIIELISNAGHIHIACIIDNSKRTETTYKSIVEQSMEDMEKRDGQFYKGTLRRRQVLESETSVIVIGDVEAGAKIIAKGNVVVIGSVYGSIHAGAAGDTSAFIVALSMHPKKLRVADVEAQRYVLSQKELQSPTPKIAVVDRGHLYIDPLVQ